MAASIGTSVPLPAYTIDSAFLALKAEELGFESIWFAEHPVLPVQSDSEYPGSGGAIPENQRYATDPFIALARASAVTSKIKLATGVALVPERHPLAIAKSVAALDYYSGGRFIFGIGAGWHREETTIMGGNFDRRWSQTREAILAMKELWTKDEAEFHGEFYDFPPVYCYPKPVQNPHPPVLLGGHAKNVLKRAVAWGDGWLPNRATPELIETSRQTLDSLSAEAGRSPESLSITVYGQLPDRTLVRSLLDAGADRVVVRPQYQETEEAMGEELERMAEEVIR
jgi:probable F420-dependent oxidoreductase